MFIFSSYCQFSIGVAQFEFLQAVLYAAVYPHPQVVIYISAILVHVGWYFIVVLICISMKINEWTLLCMLISHLDIPFLWSAYSSLSSILRLDCLFFVILICTSSLYICDMSPLLDIFIANIFFHSVGMQLVCVNSRAVGLFMVNQFWEKENTGFHNRRPESKAWATTVWFGSSFLFHLEELLCSSCKMELIPFTVCFEG